MTPQQANEIVDGIEAVLTSPSSIGGTFNPLSHTGASSRTELAHAVYLVTADVFRSVRRDGKDTGADSEFSNFARSAGGSLAHVLMLSPCLPDIELSVIAKLPRDTVEYCRERSRLRQLAMTDGAMQLETMEPFVTFLHTLDASSEDYWPRVYTRIALLCPTELINTQRPLSSSPQRKPWWRFW